MTSLVQTRERDWRCTSSALSLSGTMSERRSCFFSTNMPMSTVSTSTQSSDFDLETNQKIRTNYLGVVYKRAPISWISVYNKRTLTIQTGMEPTLEYARIGKSSPRGRQPISDHTVVTRISKLELQVTFNQISMNDPGNPAQPENPLNWVFRFVAKSDRDSWAKRIQDAIDSVKWLTGYALGPIISETDISSVCFASGLFSHNLGSYAVKILSTTSKREVQSVREELKIHKLLTQYSNCDNILKLADSLRLDEKTYMLLEFCSEGDMSNLLSEKKYFLEAESFPIMVSLLRAIHTMHSLNVVHFDIKPENVLLASIQGVDGNDYSDIRLSDFGSAKMVNEFSYRHIRSGTVGYASPEQLLKNTASFESDIFSAGALLYTLLCGSAPFYAVTEDEIIQNTIDGTFLKTNSRWMKLSPEVQDLISKMLIVDPEGRITIQEIFQHPWMSKSL